MPSIIDTCLYLGGLAIFWLYFRISTDQTPVPDNHRGQHALADEYGEVLIEGEYELPRSTNEAQRQIEENRMILDSWDRGEKLD